MQGLLITDENWARGLTSRDEAGDLERGVGTAEALDVGVPAVPFGGVVGEEWKGVMERGRMERGRENI